MFFKSPRQADVSHSNALGLRNRLPGKGLTSIIALFLGLGTFGCAEFPNVSFDEEVLRVGNHVSFKDFSPDSQTILTLSEDSTAKLWDLEGNLLTTLQGVTSGEFSPDGQTILATSWGSTYLWDLEGNLLHTLLHLLHTRDYI